MPITDEMELDLLRKRADFVGCYVQRHKNADIFGGDLYLMERRTPRNPRPPTLLKYASADQISDALAEIESIRLRRRA